MKKKLYMILLKFVDCLQRLYTAQLYFCIFVCYCNEFSEIFCVYFQTIRKKSEKQEEVIS